MSYDQRFNLYDFLSHRVPYGAIAGKTVHFEHVQSKNLGVILGTSIFEKSLCLTVWPTELKKRDHHLTLLPGLQTYSLFYNALDEFSLIMGLIW